MPSDACDRTVFIFALRPKTIVMKCASLFTLSFALAVAVLPHVAHAKKQKLSEYMEGTLWNWNNWREVKPVSNAISRPIFPRARRADTVVVWALHCDEHADYFSSCVR